MEDEDKRIDQIKNRIRSYEDFPKKGINFKDIFPLFQHPSLLPDVTELMFEHVSKSYQNIKVDCVFGLDARGFLIGPQLALKLNCSFLPIRKKGKLPGEVIGVTYELEYGNDTIELQNEFAAEAKNCIIVDDLMATGGTMLAACNLVEKCNVNILCCYCILHSIDLKGENRLPKHVLFKSLVKY